MLKMAINQNIKMQGVTSTQYIKTLHRFYVFYFSLLHSNVDL